MPVTSIQEEQRIWWRTAQCQCEADGKPGCDGDMVVRDSLRGFTLKMSWHKDLKELR